jgi:HTH-type transcriptional regulator / antitoxin HigA
MDERRRPARVVAPGRVIATELEERGWDQKDLARIMDRPEQTISEIMRAKKQITPETAIELSEVFGTSPEFWANLEANYRLHLAAASGKGHGISKRSQLYSLAPVRELLKRHWIPATNDPEELESSVLAFLGQSSLTEAAGLAANFRMTTRRTPDTRATLAWVRRVETLAAAQTVSTFELERLRDAMPAVLHLAASEESVRDLPGTLMCLGVHFVMVPHLPKTYVDGAALAVNGEPVVAVSLRFDRMDSFWFTVLHELAHIVLGHKGTFVDDLEDTSSPGRSRAEKEADRIASDWLLEPKALKAFLRRSALGFSLREIQEFSRSQSRHPAIVVGWLQHEGLVGWSHFRKVLVKVGPSLSDWNDLVGPEATPVSCSDPIPV